MQLLGRSRKAAATGDGVEDKERIQANPGLHIRIF